MQLKVLGPREAPSQARQAGTAPLPGLLRMGGLMRPLCQGFNVLESPLQNPTCHSWEEHPSGTLSVSPDSGAFSEAEKGWHDCSLGRTCRQGKLAHLGSV